MNPQWPAHSTRIEEKILLKQRLLLQGFCKDVWHSDGEYSSPAFLPSLAVQIDIAGYHAIEAAVALARPAPRLTAR